MSGVIANNIALLKLKKSIDLDATSPAKTISLYDTKKEFFEDGAEATVLGWGETTNKKESGFLQSLNVTKVSLKSCQKCWWSISEVPDKTICAENSPHSSFLGYVTKGDSGGPLVTSDGKLAGILSVGSSGECPDVFTDTLSFKNWIMINTGRTSRHTASSSRQKRLVKGIPTEETDDFGSMAAIGDKSSTDPPFCGASIYNDLFVITAAHCVYEEEETSIEVRVSPILKSTRSKTYKVDKIIRHKDYNTHKVFPPNDIALLKLKTPISLNSKYIRAIELYNKPTEKEKSTILGWGDIDSYEKGENILQKLEANGVNLDECKLCYKKMFNLPKDTFCAATSPRDAKSYMGAEEDIGDPLVMDGKLIGLAIRGREGKCPDFFLNVTYHEDWIIREAV